MLWKRNSLVPSFLSGEQNRNDDRRKNIMWLLAKNPARDTHKCVYKYKTWLLSSLASASPEHGGKCRAKRGDRGKCAYTGQNRCCVLLTCISVLRFYSNLPLPTAIVATFPDKRGRLMFVFFSLWFKSASTAFLCESFQYFLILLFWKPENMSLFPQSSFKNGLKGRKNERDITNGNNLYKTLEIGGKIVI